ncbi:MOB kinase activator-like 1 [Trichonephila clavipes]|nr:MOB kinase activator-like 1 [Trichonephila clavipes]
MSFLFGGRSSKTFKPKKNIPEGTHQYDLMKHAAATLGSGNLRLAVMLPEGEDLNEWVAVNTVDFFNQINMLYGTITEFCTEESCAVMSAGPKYEYHWADGQTVKKPIKCSAPKYIDYLMTWVQDQLDDENLFPSKIVMSFLGKGKKADLIKLAIELGECESKGEELKIIELRTKILTNDAYKEDPEFVKCIFEGIVSNRIGEENKQKEETLCEFELQKIRLQNKTRSRRSTNPTSNKN